MPRNFKKDASLVLIGMRCCGKSSLASIAAKALDWKVVDEKLQFQTATGYSVAGYIKKYGVKAYCAREVQILNSILTEHQHCRIIVCSSSCVETQAGRDLLRQFLSILPIVHIMRDRDVLQTYLESKWKGNVAKILRSQEPVYLSCSNLTFFNTDAASAGHAIEDSPSGIFEAVTSPSDKPSSQFLSLKRVESDFLRFLGNVYGWPNEDNRRIVEDATVFNYALQLPFHDFKNHGERLASLTCSADLLQVQTDVLLQGYFAIENPTQTWWEYVVDQLAYLRSHANQPILYHAVTLCEYPSAIDLDYFDLVQLGLRVGAEFVTIDLTKNADRIEAMLKPKGHCKFVGWFHDTDPEASGGWISQNRLSWYEKAMHLGCDILHITQPAIDPMDNDLAHWFSQTMKIKGSLLVSSYNTGSLGRPSQCFNKTLTMVRHPDIIEDKSEAITITQAQGALFSSFSCEPLRFSVMGATVGYSLAPVLHNSAFEVYGMPHEYSISQAANLDFLDSLVQDDHFGGLGLSSPFKTSIITRLHAMSEEARVIGAVNTIFPMRQWNDKESPSASIAKQRNRAGVVIGLYGENTDWKGIKSCALRYLSPANAITSLSTALIVGAGGMARAAIYAMIKAGIRNICIYNRTHQHAIDLAHHFGEVFHDTRDNKDDGHSHPRQVTLSTLGSLNTPWPSDMRFPTVVVNCSPVPGDKIALAPPTHQGGGVGPQPAVSIPAAWLRSPTGGVYMELAYNSITSSPELLRICSETNRGWIGVAGLEIFIEVASAQFEFWTGRRAPKHSMKKKLRLHLQKMQQDMAQ